MKSFNQRQSDDFRQLVRQTVRNSVHSLDENFVSLPRRSVSYGFGLGIKPSQDAAATAAEPTIISPNYRLPSNKIDLEMNEEHFIRRAGSLKRKSVSD